MLGWWARRKSQPRWVGAGGWYRDPTNVFAKRKAMADGELLCWLLDLSEVESSDVLETAYERLKEVRAELTRAFGAAAVAIAFGSLVYIGALDEFSAAGLKIAGVFFPHTALLAISASSFWISVTEMKVGFFRSIFLWKWKGASSSKKALLLLKYPQAYWYFYFLPAAVGYPPNTWPKREGPRPVLLYAMLVLSIVCGWLGVFSLWIALAAIVWSSPAGAPWAAFGSILSAATLLVLALIAPNFGTGERTYVHYGLSRRMQDFSGDKKERAHRRVAAARNRMRSRSP